MSGTSVADRRPTKSGGSGRVGGTRRGVKVTGVVVAVVVVAAIVAVVVGSGGSSSTSDPHYFTLAKSVDGFTLHTTGKPVQQSIADDFAQGFQAKNIKGGFTAVYAKSASVNEGIVFAGFDAGLFTDTLKQINSYDSAQENLAVQNGAPAVIAYEPGKNYPAGPRGGSVSCGTTLTATEGFPAAACAWADGKTNGYAISIDEKPAQLATNLAAIRVVVEKP